MFLINRVSSSRKASREFNSVLTVDDPSSAADMENTFIAPLPTLRRKRAVTEVKRHSRMPSFFGNGAKEDTVEDLSRPTSRVSIVEPESSRFFFSTRRKLKKSASKASLSLASPPILESPRETEIENTKSKSRSPIGLSSPPRRGSDRFIHPISEPYSFKHVEHAEKNDYAHVRRGSNSIKRDPVSPASTVSTRNSRLWRSRSNSTISPAESLLELPIMKSQESLKQSRPMPPPRMSSKQALYIATPPAQEEFIDPATIGIATTPLDEPEEFIAHAITTEGDYTLGKKSPGIAKVFFDASKLFPEPEQTQEEPTVPMHSPVAEASAELRKAMSTPDMSNVVRDGSGRQRSSTVVRTVSSNPGPISTGRYSPLSRRSSIRRRSTSRRFSFKLTPPITPSEQTSSIMESWEDVIDYSYSQEAESTFDYDWDRFSVYSENGFYGLTESFDSQASFDEIPTPLGAIDEEVHRPSLNSLSPGRLTGLFEDKLLLPGTPLSTRFPEYVHDIGIADGGFDIPPVENTDIILRAANTTLRHRSMKSASSLRELVPAARIYREEFARFTQHMDAQLTAGSDKKNQLPQSLTVPQRFTSRPRTDSNATCATLCSDNELSLCESAEIITPPLSTHSSFDVLHSKAFPPQAKSTIEYAPNDVHVVGFEEDEIHLNLF